MNIIRFKTGNMESDFENFWVGKFMVVDRDRRFTRTVVPISKILTFASSANTVMNFTSSWHDFRVKGKDTKQQSNYWDAEIKYCDFKY